MKGLEGVKVIEVGGAAAMPLAGMLMAGWGAEVIHVEPPGRGDMMRGFVREGASGWIRPHPVNYIWEHVARNKRSMAVDMAVPLGQAVLHRLASSADVFLNNLRPYEVEKFNLSYPVLSRLNPRIIWANLTGYGRRGPERDAGGYDSVAFWARSGVMDLLHEAESPPPISRPAYGDSISSICLLAGVMTALYLRERSGQGQEVEVSLYNTATWVLGFDLSGCLITGEDPARPQRRKMANPIRNLYPTQDNRWIMLGMTNAQHYWPRFCQAIERTDLEKDPRFATYQARAKNAQTLVSLIEGIFRSKTYGEWIEILKVNRLVWSPVVPPQQVIYDEQAQANEFFVDWDHPRYGEIRVLNHPIKLSGAPAQIRRRAPDLGEHTREILSEAGYSEEEIARMIEQGVVG